MKWSKYNTLFRYEGHGPFCHNTLSNVLIELDETHYDLLAKFQRSYDPPDIQDNEFLKLLQEKHVLVEAGEEENLLITRQYLQQAACFETASLGLTICPTLRCNFRCPYCFEKSQQDGHFMSDETQERLIVWIKEKKNARNLSVVWYGGEPLLAFDTICSLTERFLSIGLDYDKAILITNGYLLDRKKIARLNDLKIGQIQITLDGPPDVHDTRRVLANGGPTFTRILENVTSLMDSDYAGECSIRVNVDKSNLSGFLELRAELMNRFKGKKLNVYPGYVSILAGQNYDSSHCLKVCEFEEFLLELAQRQGIFPQSGIYPRSQPIMHCVATKDQGFVLGPDGEIYKCWDDVGRPAMVIGNIHAKGTITNPVLRALYVTGVDPYNDPECRSCTVLGICGGGCPHKRMLVKCHSRKEIEFCSVYKTHLQKHLEAYVDFVRTYETGSALLKPGKTEEENPGYRVISPKVHTHKQQESEC